MHLPDPIVSEPEPLPEGSLKLDNRIQLLSLPIPGNVPIVGGTTIYGHICTCPDGEFTFMMLSRDKIHYQNFGESVSPKYW